MRSKTAWRRDMRSIDRRRKHRGPPKGRNGGKSGNVRGEFMEQLVNNALVWLEEQRRILSFRQEDGQRKDFVVFVQEKKGRRRYTIEVKSSECGRTKYWEKIEEMRRKGKGKCEPADLVIVVDWRDDIFTLAQQIVGGLGLS